jgi:ribonuclease HII
VGGFEPIIAELSRLGCLRAIEERLERSGLDPVAGVDEAGRGCLAGPVVAAAVIPRGGPALPGVDDSKRLTADAREALAAHIRATAVAFAVCAVPAAAIDRTDILRATRQAMLGALAALAARPAVVLTDAVALPETGLPTLALVKGDALAYAVACASILAKQYRDQLMVALDSRYPHYGFARHKGYASPEHLGALTRFGPSPEHRLRFARVVPRREAA